VVDGDVGADVCARAATDVSKPAATAVRTNFFI
jgi:hypothetical protein